MNVGKTFFLETVFLLREGFLSFILRSIEGLGREMKKVKWGILSVMISRWLDRIIIAVQEAIGPYNIETATKIRVRKSAIKVD